MNDELSDYTEKQKAKAQELIEQYKARGLTDEEAERRAWQSINTESGGDKKSDTRTGDRE